VGPWLTGVLYDATGSYTAAWWLAIAATVVSGASVWFASPRKVRVVAGRVPRRAGAAD